MLCDTSRDTKSRLYSSSFCYKVTLLSIQGGLLLCCDYNRWRLQSSPVKLLEVYIPLKLGMGVFKEKKKLKICIYCLRSETMKMRLYMQILKSWWKGVRILWGPSNLLSPFCFGCHPLGLFSLHLLQSYTQNMMSQNIIKKNKFFNNFINSLLFGNMQFVRNLTLHWKLLI